MSTERTRVLVVEDELQVRRFVRATLRAQGYEVLEATTLAEARLMHSSHNPELVLLDLGLPDGDGAHWVRELREWSAVPILILSARGREADKVEALDAGADDYVTKPFAVGELLARMRVALRRMAVRVVTEADQPVWRFGDLVLDMMRREVRRGTEELRLTPIEFKLLTTLARHADRVLTHRQIVREVWGGRTTVDAHHVRVHMAELRKKIEREPSRPQLLVTEQGVGYRLRPPAEDDVPEPDRRT